MEVSPVILSAVISAAIAIITLIISTSITLRKNIHEERSYFEKSLKEKLENIYAPMNLEMNSRNSSEKLISTKCEELISKYGYLLRPLLLSDLKTLINLEHKNNDFLNDEDYSALRNMFKEEFNKDFAELQILYDKHFENYRKKYTKDIFDKFIKIVGVILVSITILFYATIYFKDVYKSINNSTHLIDHPLLNFLYTNLLIVVGTTTGVFFFVLISRIFRTIINKIKKRYYKPSDRVPETGFYYCQICKRKFRKVKYTKFGDCENFTKTQSIKKIFNQRYWKKL